MASPTAHVVAIPVEAQGHAFPMMNLCCYLAKKGFKITFLVMLDTSFAAEWVKRNSSSWPPQELHEFISVVQLPGEFPCKPREHIGNMVRAMDFMIRNYKIKVQEFLRIEAAPVSAVICDYQKAWIVDIARDLGIPAAVLFTGSAMWSWLELQMPQLVSQNLVPMQAPALGAEDDRVISEELGLLKSHIPWHYWNEKPWQEYASRHNSGVFSKADWVLVSSCGEIESQATAAMKELIGSTKYMPVGPLYLLSKPPRLEEHECLVWLDKQAPSSVLYISFGSIASLSQECIRELLQGLEGSGCKYLWVRKMEVEGEDIDDKSGNEKESQGFIFSKWSPQTLLLAHPSVGAFLTHCGWNSTVEGAVNGLPLLCWPCVYEQNLNTRIIVEIWQTGAVFNKSITRPNLVEKEEVQRVIKLVMEEEEGKLMKKRAVELAGKIKAAVMPGGSSLTNLDRFIHCISSGC